MSKRNKIALMMGVGTWIVAGAYITALLPRADKALLNAGRGMIGFVVGGKLADEIYKTFKDYREDDQNGRSEVTADEQQSGETSNTNESETA